MANTKIPRMCGLWPTVILVLILCTDRGKCDGMVKKIQTLLPTGLSGSWGENDIGNRDIWAARGSSLVLPCNFPDLPRIIEAVGPDSVNFTWLRNNETLINKRSWITTEGHLHITKLMRRRNRKTLGADEGEYRCILDVKVGGFPWVISSAAIFLHVANMSRHVKIFPSRNVSVLAGEALRLGCQIESEPRAQYAWIKDDVPLSQGNTTSQLNKGNSGVLQIINVQKSHAASYKCTATNSILDRSRSSDPVHVIVDSSHHHSFIAPSFLFPTNDSSVDAIEGRNIVMECLATGIPLPVITWHRKFTYSNKVQYKIIQLGNEFSTSGSGNLVLKSVSADLHSGAYVCQATSVNPDTGTSSVISQETFLKVIKPPKITSALRNVTTVIASTVRLNCTHESIGADVSWYKDGRPIVIDTRVQIGQDNQLVIINSVTKDTGVYQCLVQNYAGFATSWSYLLVNSSEDHPDPPTNLHSTVLSPTSVILTWSWEPVHSTDKSQLKAYSVHYEKMGDLDGGHTVAMNNSLLIDSLTPHTNYSFRVRAYTEHASDHSENGYFTTNDDVPIDVPEFHLEALSPSTILVKWSPISPKKARGTIAGYKVQWQRRSKHYYNLFELEPDEFEHIIIGLHPGKTYKVRVMASTSAGYNEREDWKWKMISMPEVNHKSANAPRAPKLALKIVYDSEGGKTLNISWSRAVGDTSELTGYVLKYRNSVGIWSKDKNLPSSASSYVIKDLYDAHLYRIKIWGIGLDGAIGAATMDTVTTISEPPAIEMPTIKEVKVKLESRTIVNLSWRADQTTDSREIAFYTICQKQSDSAAEVKPIYRRSTRNSISIGDLTPYSIYQFSVRAHISENEYGPYSDPVGTNALVAPKKVAFEPKDASTVELSWDLVDLPDGPLTKYQIIYSPNQNLPLSSWKKKEVEGDQLKEEISGLVSNTEYWFRVRGCSDILCGSYSEPIMAFISAILPPDSTSPLYLVIGLVGTVAILILVAFLAIYLLKFRKLLPNSGGGGQPTLALSCNGNGSSKHGTDGGYRRGSSSANSGIHVGRNGTVADINGSDGDYIPMLNRIQCDLPPAVLDTKGGYPTSQLNGFLNHRPNGVIRGKEHLVYGTAIVNPGKAVESEECEHLFTPSATPSVDSSRGEINHSSTNKILQTEDDNVKMIGGNTLQMTSLRQAIFNPT